jgi:hypothetical protein
MSDENTTVPVFPAELRRNAERQRDDAETIIRLTSIVESLVSQVEDLRGKLAKTEAQIPKPPPPEGKDSKK